RVIHSIAINVELELQQRHTTLKVRHRHGSYRINQRSLSISVEKFYPTRDRIKVTTSGFNTHSLAIRFSYRQGLLRRYRNTNISGCSKGITGSQNVIFFFISLSCFWGMIGAWCRETYMRRQM